MEKDYLQAEIQDESLMDFMKNHTPDGKNSKLEPFKQQIFFLKEQGYSSTQIALFLEEKKGVKITRQAVEKFIKTRHSQQNTFPVFKKRMVDTVQVLWRASITLKVCSLKLSIVTTGLKQKIF